MRPPISSSAWEATIHFVKSSAREPSAWSSRGKHPRKEQIIRARAFNRQNLVDYIPWDDFTPELLSKKVAALLQNPEPYRAAISRFQLTGIETMQKRLLEFRCKKL